MGEVHRQMANHVASAQVTPPRTAPQERIQLLTPTPQFRFLAIFQVVVGFVTLSFAFLGLEEYSESGVKVLLAALWLLLALATAGLGPRIGQRAEAVSLSLSSALLATGSATAMHPSIQILNGIGIMLLGVFAGYTLSRRRVTLFVAFSVGVYVASFAVTDFVGGLWVPVILVAMVIFNTAHVWTLVDRLRETTLTDPLTGALNRNGLAIKAPDVRAVADRAGNPTTVTVVDLDKFKQVNDRLGHSAGDQVLLDTVRAWSATLRSGDQVARIGGDEFVLLTPNCDVERAEAVLARLRSVSPCGWSSGTVLWNRADGDIFAAVRAADTLMYQSKRSHGPD